MDLFLNTVDKCPEEQIKDEKGERKNELNNNKRKRKTALNVNR